MKACDCEYHTHGSSLMSARSPETHQYGKKFADDQITVVHTIHGPYNICKSCQQDHPIPAAYLKPTLPEGSPHATEAGRD